MNILKAYCVSYYPYGPWSNSHHIQYFFNMDDAQALFDKHQAVTRPSFEPRMDQVAVILFDNHYYSLGSPINIS
jgi:hypothetical protein